MSEDLFNTREAAQYLRVHEKQLYMLVKEKRIPATHVTGKWIFPRKLLDEWIEADARKNLGKVRERGYQRDAALPRQRVGRMGGYDLRDCGTVLTREP